MTPASNELSGKSANTGMRAPSESGQVLFSFPPGDLQSAVLDHQHRLASESVPKIAGIALPQLCKLGRTELLNRAVTWTGRYRDIPSAFESMSANDKPFVLSGHQPTLFHPGVWFKNFILSRLGRKLNAVVINLIIDNDLGGTPGVMIPSVSGTRATWQSVPYDLNSARVPMEFQRLHDPAILNSFPERLARAVSRWTKEPLVHRLWPHVLKSAKIFPELGFVLAAGRHRLESELKMQTLEVPLSEVCRTEAFSHFVAEIFSRPAEFAMIHNRCLDEFRSRNGIRSPSHPVPPLIIDDNSVELPFWIYSIEHPVRKRLVLQTTPNGLSFPGPGGEPITIDGSNFSNQILELVNGPVCLRPRALLTTMFSRLVLSDLFVHGIGGAVYDQITDAIAADFFEWQLPRFATTTATFRLVDWSSTSANSHLAYLTNRLRQMTYHPETALENEPNAQDLIQSKRHLQSKMSLPNDRRLRHFEMLRINDHLRDQLVDPIHMLEEEIEAKKSQLERNRIVASREVSFCAHAESLPAQLADSAATVF